MIRFFVFRLPILTFLFSSFDFSTFLNFPKYARSFHGFSGLGAVDPLRPLGAVDLLELEAHHPKVQPVWTDWDGDETTKRLDLTLDATDFLDVR